MRFISDVHLPPEGSRPAAARVPVFLDFLDRTARLAEQGRCGMLCVLGDLFGFWFEAGGKPPRGYDRVLRAMRDAVSRGLKTVVLHGNRDFLLGPAFTKATGAELAPDEMEISLGAKRICLMHGDALVWDDHRYQVWRRLSRGGSFRRLANGLPRRLAESVARAFRLGSEFEKSVKARTAMAYSPGALRARIAGGADVIVAGHVHEAGEFTIEAAGREGRLLTLGSWDQGRGAFVEWTGEELRLVPGRA